ncbi:MarR family winged helix-turn-helix transcriptional regulator [Streptomyces sp. NPDC001599]|uniref:MarR family winged helix-turn-helix transcriptional regulator n=1 Tax=Streptomyces sp. NPDC001599 TaxID=3364591 RepID=UPI0036BFB28A
MTAAETPDETTVVPGGCPADAAVETIQREMTVFARRARASAGRMHPELSLVSYTLLGHLEERDGRRATDLAAHYALDKSTVSRQVSALERAGLIERRVDPDDHRVQVLHLTESGRQVLDRVTERRRAAFRERLADWPEEELLRFAAYLERYNAWPDGAPGRERDRAAAPDTYGWTSTH